MKNLVVSAAVLLAAGLPALAQTNRPSVEDFKPATTNQPGQPYPQVNSEGRVRARIRWRPRHKSVQLNISGVKYPMTKGTNGFWIGDSTPQDQGNHYYGLVVDGAEVPDPNGSFIFGSGAWRNDVEIPANDQDFYALKNVPHGQMREILYFGKTQQHQSPLLCLYSARLRQGSEQDISRCSICSTATTKMKPAGAIRAVPA